MRRTEGLDLVRHRLQVWIRRYPVTVFQLIVFTIHHDTVLAWSLLLAAPLYDKQIRYLEAVDGWLAELWKVVRFVHNYASCEYKRFDLFAVLERPAFDRFQRQLFRERQFRVENFLTKLFRRRSLESVILERTRLYTVSRGLGRTRPGPSSFKADLGGFIFVTESPDNISGAYKFFLLHELGHLSPIAKYTWSRGRAGGAPFFGLFLWTLPQLLFPTFSLWTLLFILLNQFVITLLRDAYWYTVRRFGMVLDEIHADKFACQSLKPKELLAVAEFYKDRPIPEDPTIPSDDPGLQGMDALRRRTLAKNFELARARRGNLSGYFTVPQQSQTEMAVWASFLIALPLIAVANPPSCNSVIAEFILSTGVMSLMFFLLGSASGLQRKVENILSGPAIPASQVKSWPSEPVWQKRLRHLLGYEALKLGEDEQKTMGSRILKAIPASLTIALGLTLASILNALPNQSYCLLVSR